MQIENVIFCVCGPFQYSKLFYRYDLIWSSQQSQLRGEDPEGLQGPRNWPGHVTGNWQRPEPSQEPSGYTATLTEQCQTAPVGQTPICWWKVPMNCPLPFSPHTAHSENLLHAGAVRDANLSGPIVNTKSKFPLRGCGEGKDTIVGKLGHSGSTSSKLFEDKYLGFTLTRQRSQNYGKL